jgi:UPF0755 protein
MRKKIIVSLVAIIFIIATSLLFFNLYYKSIIKRPFKSSDKIQVKIEKGDSLYTILNSLDENNKLRNKYLIKKYIKKINSDILIKVGVCDLSDKMTIKDFLDALENNVRFDSENDVKVTIPEGYNIEEIGVLLQEKNVITKEKFIQACKEYKMPENLKNDEQRRYKLEGFLFADTYEFKKNAEGNQIIKTMLERFEQVIKDVEKSENKTLNTEQLDNVITIASIIEKEVSAPTERKLASSVFYNRLRDNMPLQSCATVLYALGIHKNIVTNEDLKVNSPYNTYRVASLPEGPICSPSKESIIAAISPDKTNYYYFVSKNDGTHEFNETYEGHMSAVNKYQNK